MRPTGLSRETTRAYIRQEYTVLNQIPLWKVNEQPNISFFQYNSAVCALTQGVRHDITIESTFIPDGFETTMDSAYTLHFTCQTVTIDQGGEPQTITTSELVAPDTVLVSISPNLPPEVTPTLVCGRYCQTPDKFTAVARVAGYPQFSVLSKGGKLTLNIDLVPLVQISSNNMMAEITLYPPVESPYPLSVETIRAVLADHGIIHGLEDGAFQRCEELLNGPPFAPVTLSVAHGVMPVNGRDSYLRFELEIGPIPGTFLKDGTIDYRERRIFVGVGEQQLIATKVRETPGTAGMDIFGHKLPPVPGRDLPLKISGDVIYLEDSRQVIATRPGTLSVVNNNEVKVGAKQTIDGDVDFSVGNLQTQGSLQIRGSILPAFSVRTKGDLLLEGNVQAGTINSHGNVVIRGGVLEKSGAVYAGGDIDVGFVERGELSAEGNITVRKSAYYCRFVTDGDMVCAPECRFVGSVAQCAGNFTATDIGSPKSVAATIIAGVDRRRFERYLNLRHKLKLLHNQLDRLEKTKGDRVVSDKRYLQLRTTFQNSHNTLIHSNLCPDGPERCNDPEEMFSENITITIHGTIYAGTKLRIGNFTKTLKWDYSHTTFQVDPAIKTISTREIQ